MAKLAPVLFYTLMRTWSRDYEVLAVTTAKRTQFFGRRMDNSATHVVAGECKGRFETAEAAQSRIAAVKAVRARHKPAIEAAEKESSRLRYLESSDIDLALAGELDG